MRDSDTYRYILEQGEEKGIAKGIEKGIAKGIEKGREQGREQGRIIEVKKMISQLGRKMLGTPGKKVAATLKGIDDLNRLERLHQRLADVKSWSELLATE